MLECGLDRVEAEFVCMDGDRHVVKFDAYTYKSYKLVRPIEPKPVAREWWIDPDSKHCVHECCYKPNLVHVREITGDE